MTQAMQHYAVPIPPVCDGLRLDQAVPACIDQISRTQARKLILIGAVWVNGARLHIASRAVHSGDRVDVYIGRDGCEKRYEIDPAHILFEDDCLLFYRKEPGVLTQGIFCDNYNNLYAALLRYLRTSTPRPYLGMHHRLDGETSGVLVFTKTPSVNRSIHVQFQKRRITKIYDAVVRGVPEFDTTQQDNYILRENGRYCCSATGPGKAASATFTCTSVCGSHSHVQARPQTGRTHQIRLQLAFLGLPVLGDRLYGSGTTDGVGRMMLHARSLCLTHPRTNQEMTVEAELFEDMAALLGTTAAAPQHGDPAGG